MQSQTQKCEILGFLGYAIQLVLGLLSFTVLIGKRQIEQPKRLWKIFIMDSSKQMSSAMIGHIMNVILAQILSNAETSDPCNWYFITYFCDCTFGVLLCFILMKGFEILFELTGQIVMLCGNYYRIEGLDSNTMTLETKEKQAKQRKVTIDYKVYSFQLILWNFVVFLSKSILFLLEKTLSLQLQDTANWLFKPQYIIYNVRLNNQPLMKLIVVMAIIPLLLNSICFWVQDSILKKSGFRANEKELVMDLLYERCENLTEIDSGIELQHKKKKTNLDSKKGRMNLSGQEEI